MSITVYVKVWGILRQHHPGPDRSQAIPISLATGATVAELRRTLDMPPELVNHAFAYLGDEVVPPEHILADGDLLNLAPAVAGG